MKKFLKGVRWFLSLLAMGCLLLAFACGETEDPTDGKKPQVTVSQSELTIENYESAFLRATVKHTTGTVVWQSSAPTVATVDENGKVSALSVGETTVTASVGEASASCKVFVIEPSTEPTITADYEEISVKETGNFPLSFGVLWGGQEIPEQAEFSFLSGNTAIATVTPLQDGKSCKVTGVQAGETLLTVKAVVRGKTAYKMVAIQVKREEVSFNAVNANFGVSADGYTVDVATVSVKNHVNTVALEFYATYRGERIDDLSIDWATEDTDVVQVGSGGTLTSVKAGQATVKGTYYYAPLDATYTITVLVNVYKPQFALDDCYFALNKTTAEVTVPTKETSAKMTVGETTKAVAIENGKALLNTDVGFMKRNANNAVSIETDLYVFTINVKVDDYSIESKEDFIKWYRTDYFATAPDGAHYCDGQSIVLNADIDLTGETFNHTTAKPYAIWEDGLFYGTFDGNNHVIANYTGDVGFLPQVGATGVVKNLTMLNVVNTGTKGFLGQFFLGEMENCYFQGKQTANTESLFFTSTYSRWTINTEGNAHKGKAKSMKNVVVNVERTSGETVDVMSDDTPYNVVIENVFVVSNKNNGKRFKDTTWTSLRSLSAYATLAEMQTAVTKLPAGCDESVWQMQNGTLATKSAVDYCNAYYGDILKQIVDVEEVFVGVGIKLPTGIIEWSFDLEEGDYTFADGTLTVTDETCIGHSFTITAKIQSPDGLYSGEKIVTARNVFPLPTMKTAKDVLVGLNKTAGAEIVVEETGLFARVFVDGVELQSGFAVNGNKIQLEKSCFGTAGVKAVEVRLLQNGYTAFIYTLNAEVFDYTIATKDEWKAWYIPTNASYNGEGVTVALTADIDLSGQAYVQPTSGMATNSFKGTFDGKGHVISNFKGLYGLIPYLVGTLKNVAMVDMTVTGNRGFLGTKCYGTVENCYFQGQHTYETSSAYITGFYDTYQGDGMELKRISNVVVDMYRPNAASETDPMTQSTVPYNATAIQNVYMIYNAAKNTVGFNGGLASAVMYKNNHFYKTLADMTAEVTSLPTVFSASEWTYSEAYGIIMNSALAYRQAQTN